MGNRVPEKEDLLISSSRTSKLKGVRAFRALALLVAVIFNLLLLLGLAFYLLDDDDYRQVLIWSADYFLDSQLEIEGAFSLNVDQIVELRAETIRLQANDGSYDLSIGKLDLQQRFGSYLMTGKLWFNHLHVEDLRGEVKETGARKPVRGMSLTGGIGRCPSWSSKKFSYVICR
jgi:hypothetical protein